MARVVFRLGEMYDYSEALLADAEAYERERTRAAANQELHPEPLRDSEPVTGPGTSSDSPLESMTEPDIDPGDIPDAGTTTGTNTTTLTEKHR